MQLTTKKENLKKI
jgi:hypothetical protein